MSTNLSMEVASHNNYSQQLYNLKKKKNLVAPFHGWGSTASRLEPLRGSNLLFTTKFPDILGTHFTTLEG